MSINILVTGGSGFIGSAFIRKVIKRADTNVLNLDKLTYASNPNALKYLDKLDNYFFSETDITNEAALTKALFDFQPNFIFHFAAESHVDNSIAAPRDFLETNVRGTYELLETTRKYLDTFPETREEFRFFHISTDEVYGDLRHDESPFTELHAYKPSSPYSASKAASDHFVRAWGRTFNIPYVITNCSNNYGPFQHSEKLIPTVIDKIISGKKIPVYGNGLQVRDWLYVDDHVDALLLLKDKAIKFDHFNIGGNCEKTNLDLISAVYSIIESNFTTPYRPIKKLADLVEFIEDRPGHDIRYAIDSDKIYSKFGWKPKTTLNVGLTSTISDYLKLSGKKI